MNNSPTIPIATDRPIRCVLESSLHGIHSNPPPPLLFCGGGGGGEKVGVRISGLGGDGGGEVAPPRIADDGIGFAGFSPADPPPGAVNGVAQNPQNAVPSGFSLPHCLHAGI